LGMSVLALVGLSIFQWLSRTSEETPQAAAEERSAQRSARAKPG
jgi:hypothetical protein